MHAVSRRFSRLCKSINKAAVILAELALFALLFLTVHAVIARYVFRAPSIHALELSQYLLLVIAWMATGWVLIEGRHVRMEALHTVLPKLLQRVCNLISTMAVLAFSFVIVWAGSINVLTAFSRGYRSSSLLSFPLWIPYLRVPTGGILLILAVTFLILRRNRQS